MLSGETDFLLKVVAKDWDVSTVPDHQAHPGPERQSRQDGTRLRRANLCPAYRLTKTMVRISKPRKSERSA